MKNDDGGQRAKKDGTNKYIKKDFCEEKAFCLNLGIKIHKRLRVCV